ncbi:MAG TPA: peptidylprolyl isomerase [Candidatus Acidoferrales bacterium]|nr:peptidylprolyl isomerase [Candidatus Acidoferrales bacterium]
MKLLTCFVLLAILTVAGVAASGNPYRTIEYWELNRSPGGNQLASLLNGSNRAVAARAALALGRTGKLLAADPLLQHTQASDTAIRAMSIYGLGLLAPALSGTSLSAMLRPLAADRKARAGNAIVDALSDDADAVRVAALDATSRFAAAGDLSPSLTTASFAQVTHILRADASPVLRGRAAFALAYYAPTDRSLHIRALHALETAYAHEDDDTARWHEMWALGRSFAKDVDGKTIAAGLADKSEIVQIQTLHVLERRLSAAWIPQVRPLTHDPRWQLNEEAHEAIAIMSGGKRTEHLRSLPPGVITPPPQPSPSEQPVSLATPPKKLHRPTIDQLIYRPEIFPHTVAQITGPANGPHPRVAIVTTQGTITLVLYPEWAPSTVASFLNLAKTGYYNNNRWFRIVPDFVVQTGDRTNTGDGDAGFTIPAEENPIEQDSGVISMGLDYDKNGPKRDSAGSQFYITLSPQLHLDLAFTVFGHVETGFDVLGRLLESDKIITIERLPDEQLGS